MVAIIRTELLEHVVRSTG